MSGSHRRWPLVLLLLLGVGFENFWLWGEDWLLFGIPVNLAYHVGLCVAGAGLLAVVARWGWPDDTDD